MLNYTIKEHKALNFSGFVETYLDNILFWNIGR